MFNDDIQCEEYYYPGVHSFNANEEYELARCGFYNAMTDAEYEYGGEYF